MAVRLQHINRSSDTQVKKDLPEVGPYEVFILLLCLLVLVTLAVEVAVPLSPATTEILRELDTVICFFFFLDFLQSLRVAPNKWRYFYTWGWIDLLSSIPHVFLARWGRAARVARLFRILRGVRSLKHILQFVLRFRRAESAFLILVLTSLLTVMFSSIVILHVETSPDANIGNAADAVWWSFVTITTVGYGDHYPVTPEGRILGGFLMVLGIGLFGTFTAFVAAWFVEPVEMEQEREMELMRKELGEIRRLLAAQVRTREVENMDAVVMKRPSGTAESA